MPVAMATTNKVERTEAKAMSSPGFHRNRQILLVENDGYCRFFLLEIFKSQSVKITTAQTLTQACEIVETDDFDLVMLNLPALNQEELSSLILLRKHNEHIPTIVVSEHSDIDFVVRVLREGAFDFLIRPFNNIARIEESLNRVFLNRDREREATSLLGKESASNGLIGGSKGIMDLLTIINQIAPLNVNVLLTGESGTGKELIARAIHSLSHRKTGPFFAVNCGAVPDGLVESIFFGHEKGAFTGATQTHVGFLEKANVGTLLLDEVDELSPKAQVSLLRFLEDRKFVRIGGGIALTSDVRIIASTNRNLEHEVSINHFRADLYFRLNVVHLRAPPLRERIEDVVHLAQYFVSRFCLANRLPLRKLSTQAVRLLEMYDFPGNVRELENLMEGLLATLPSSKLYITEKDLLAYSEKIRQTREDKDSTPHDFFGDGQKFREALQSFEASYLKTVLDKFGGNVTRAAKAAGIHPVTFHRKLRKLRLLR